MTTCIRRAEGQTGRRARMLMLVCSLSFGHDYNRGAQLAMFLSEQRLNASRCVVMCMAVHCCYLLEGHWH
jgi:hypothetical protein